MVEVEEATMAKSAGPQLHTDNAEDEEDEEAQDEHIDQHREGVQQKHHKDSHAWKGMLLVRSWKIEFGNAQ